MPNSLHCPKCKQAVTIGDQSAGLRVRCPLCQDTFVAPGVAAKAKSDDDDWLSLDDDPKMSADTQPSAAAQVSASDPVHELDDFTDVEVVEVEDDIMVELTLPDVMTGDSAPDDEFTLSEPVDRNAKRKTTPQPESEDDILNKFGEELEAFTADIEPIPDGSRDGGEDLFADLPPVGPVTDFPSAAASSSSKSGEEFPSLGGEDNFGFGETAPTADATGFQQEFRIKCPICGSLLYVKASQEGKQAKCDDCHSMIKVPAPPEVTEKQKSKQKSKPTGPPSSTFTFEDSSAKERKDPYKKSAEELLDKAALVEERDEPPTDYDAPSVREWAKNVFGIFLDPGVAIHWIGLSLLASIPAFIALSLESQVLIVGLFVGGIILSTFVVSCGFAIMQSVANEHDQVAEWPEMDPTTWLGDLVVVVAAASLAGIPAWGLGMLVFGPTLLTVAMTMLAIHIMFPFFVLSMMDMQSVFVPFSQEVARSATKCQDAWGGLYFSSGLLFFGLFLIFVALSSSAAPAPAAAISIFATIAIAFTYFAMIGRLAYAIGQVINEPARKSSPPAEK